MDTPALLPAEGSSDGLSRFVRPAVCETLSGEDRHCVSCRMRVKHSWLFGFICNRVGDIGKARMGQYSLGEGKGANYIFGCKKAYS